jgi:hypothetical protein
MGGGGAEIDFSWDLFRADGDELGINEISSEAGLCGGGP